MFSLMTLRVGQQPTPVLCMDGRYWALADVAPELLLRQPGRGLMNVFEDWTAAEPVLMQVAERLRNGQLQQPPLAGPSCAEDIMTPLQFPNKLVLVGAN